MVPAPVKSQKDERLHLLVPEWTEFESGGFLGRRVLPSVAPTPPKKPNLLKWPENLI